MDDLFALLAPVPALPPTLPEPPAVTPGSIILMLLAGAGALLETQPQPEPDPKKKEQDRQTQEKEDNKHVVKMKDVAAEIDKALTSQILLPIIYREIVNTLTTRSGSGFTRWSDASKRVSDATFDPIRAELKAAIRTHELQQQTRRKTVDVKSNQRQGSLHNPEFHTIRGAGDHSIEPGKFGGGIQVG